MLRTDWKAREAYTYRDGQHWVELRKALTLAEVPFSEMWVNFPAFIRRRDLAILLARYELFKMVVNLPGSIAEVGVYMGAGLFTWANLLETFVPGDRTRKAYGFDHYEGYAGLTAEDGDAEGWAQQCIGSKCVPEEFVEALVRLNTEDTFLPGIERCVMIGGDVSETVPQFVKESLGTRLCLMHLDVNLYAPTKVALEHLYPLVVRGGVVVLNAYGGPPWQGEVIAVEEYFIEEMPPLRKFAFSPLPGGYFIKEG